MVEHSAHRRPEKKEKAGLLDKLRSDDNGIIFKKDFMSFESAKCNHHDQEVKDILTVCILRELVTLVLINLVWNIVAYWSWRRWGSVLQSRGK